MSVPLSSNPKCSARLLPPCPRARTWRRTWRVSSGVGAAVGAAVSPLWCHLFPLQCHRPPAVTDVAMESSPGPSAEARPDPVPPAPPAAPSTSAATPSPRGGRCLPGLGTRWGQRGLHWTPVPSLYGHPSSSYYRHPNSSCTDTRIFPIWTPQFLLYRHTNFSCMATPNPPIRHPNPPTWTLQFLLYMDILIPL